MRRSASRHDRVRGRFARGARRLRIRLRARCDGGAESLWIWSPRQNSYCFAARVVQATLLRRYQQKYQQTYRRRLGQSKVGAVLNVAVPPEAKIFGDLEIDGCIGL